MSQRAGTFPVPNERTERTNRNVENTAEQSDFLSTFILAHLTYVVKYESERREIVIETQLITGTEAWRIRPESVTSDCVIGLFLSFFSFLLRCYFTP